MSVDGISFFRWFCQFIHVHCLIFILETLLSLVLHCITTLLYKYILHKFTHTRLTLTIPPSPSAIPHTLSTKPPPYSTQFHTISTQPPPYFLTSYIKGECNVFLKKNTLWMQTIHYPNKLRSHLVTIVPMAPFTPNQLQS